VELRVLRKNGGCFCALDDEGRAEYALTAKHLSDKNERAPYDSGARIALPIVESEHAYYLLVLIDGSCVAYDILCS